MPTDNAPILESVRALNDFSSKTVLITGANGQLGRAFCAAFKVAGATVIGTDIEASTNEEIACDDFKQVDTTSSAQVEELFSDLTETYGPLDVLINNAGAGVFSPFMERTEAELDKVYDVNVKGTFWCIREFARTVGNSGGRIVNIASLHGIVSADPRIYADLPRHSPEIYAATKAGVVQMTKYFATHLAPQGIGVNALSPGGVTIRTIRRVRNFWHTTNPGPYGPHGQQEDIVGGALFLASEAARYVSGHNLVIDGGYSIW